MSDLSWRAALKKQREKKPTWGLLFLPLLPLKALANWPSLAASSTYAGPHRAAQVEGSMPRAIYMLVRGHRPLQPL